MAKTSSGLFAEWGFRLISRLVTHDSGKDRCRPAAAVFLPTPTCSLSFGTPLQHQISTPFLVDCTFVIDISNVTREAFVTFCSFSWPIGSCTVLPTGPGNMQGSNCKNLPSALQLTVSHCRSCVFPMNADKTLQQCSGYLI